jgi:2-methylcitrate dehydratase PrpD
MQGPIDAILAMVREHSIQPEQVRSIEAGLLEAGWGIVAAPQSQKYNPQSVVDAQFSMPFGAAVAVLYGAAGLDQFTLAQVQSPRVREMLSKVVLSKDPRLEQNFPREWPAHATIELQDGRRYQQSIRYPKGDPENPLTWDEMAGKFRSLAGVVISAERCEEVIRGVSSGSPSGLPALCVAAS